MRWLASAAEIISILIGDFDYFRETRGASVVELAAMISLSAAFHHDVCRIAIISSRHALASAEPAAARVYGRRFYFSPYI